METSLEQLKSEVLLAAELLNTCDEDTNELVLKHLESNLRDKAHAVVFRILRDR